MLVVATGALNFGHAVDSYGAQAHERVEVEDTVVATLRFENGALGRIRATASLSQRHTALQRRA